MIKQIVIELEDSEGSEAIILTMEQARSVYRDLGEIFGDRKLSSSRDFMEGVVGQQLGQQVGSGLNDDRVSLHKRGN